MYKTDKFNTTAMCQQLKRIAKSNNQKSWATKNTYMRELNKVCRDLFAQCQVQKLENIKNIQVKNLFEHYLDDGISVSECKKRLSALRWAINYQNAWLNTKGKSKQCRFTLTNKELALGNKVFIQRYGIDEQTFDKLLGVMSKHSEYRSMAMLQYHFGLRSREAVLVNKRQVLDAISTRRFVIKEGAKGGRKRVLSLDEEQIAILKSILKSCNRAKYKDDYLFVDKGTKGNVASQLKGYQSFFYNHRHELPYTLNPNEYEHITTHSLRRSFATNQLIKYRKSYSEKEAQQLVVKDLGHSDHRTDLLKRYCGGVL